MTAVAAAGGPAYAVRLRRGELPWKVSFVGEGATDAGGPFRENIEDMCAELMSDALPFFIKSPNATNRVGTGQDTCIPTPSCYSQEAIDAYRFVGQLMGVAIRTRNYLPLRLPALFWKLLCREPVALKHLEGVDAVAAAAMSELRELAREDVDDETFESTFTEGFAVLLSDGTLAELVPGGRFIAVTLHNRLEFFNLAVQRRLRESTRQVDAIREGLASVVPLGALRLFSWRELEEVVCGNVDVDVDLLRRVTVYQGYHDREALATAGTVSPAAAAAGLRTGNADLSATTADGSVSMLWEALRRFTAAERRSFLRFVWGRTRMPLTAAEFDSVFTVKRGSAGDGAGMRLPTSSTCFFSLEWPQYADADAAERSLRFAVNNCVSQDLDFAVDDEGWVE